MSQSNVSGIHLALRPWAFDGSSGFVFFYFFSSENPVLGASEKKNGCTPWELIITTPCCSRDLHLGYGVSGLVFRFWVGVGDGEGVVAALVPASRAVTATATEFLPSVWRDV